MDYSNPKKCFLALIFHCMSPLPSTWPIVPATPPGLAPIPPMAAQQEFCLGLEARAKASAMSLEWASPLKPWTLT